MRTKKAIKRRIKAWQNNAMFVSGIYKLFTYLPFAEIPEEYKQYFNQEAIDVWDKDLDSFTEKDMYSFIDNQIRLILTLLSKGNVVSAVGLIPTVLADIFMFDYSVDQLQAKLNKLIKNYASTAELKPLLAEELATIETFEILRDVQRLLKDYRPSYNLELSEESIVAGMIEKNSKAMPISMDLGSSIDKALADYKEKTREAELENDKVQNNSLPA